MSQVPNTDDEVVIDDDAAVTEDDLRALKYDETDVETPIGEDEPDEVELDETATEDTEEENDEDQETSDDESIDSSEFVKEFPQIKGDTPEEYARNLEIAYSNSTAEAMRLKSSTEVPSVSPTSDPAPQQDPIDIDNVDPVALYAKQQMDSEIAAAYEDFKKDYSQVEELASYQNFTKTVGVMSRTILETEGRLASPGELYSKAAVALGWEKTSLPSSKEKLGMAIKDSGSTSKTPTASGQKPPVRSKVTQAMIDANKKMYPGKSDDEIRKELEPYV